MEKLVQFRVLHARRRWSCWHAAVEVSIAFDCREACTRARDGAAAWRGIAAHWYLCNHVEEESVLVLCSIFAWFLPERSEFMQNMSDAAVAALDDHSCWCAPVEMKGWRQHRGIRYHTDTLSSTGRPSSKYDKYLS